MYSYANSTVKPFYTPLPHSPRPSQQYLSKDLQQLNTKSEADRRQTFEKWPVAFIDKNHLTAAGFYYTKQSDVVFCAFCGAQVVYWEEGGG